MMDMKKILQALDTASTKPVEGSNDMKRFMQVVSEEGMPPQAPPTAAPAQAPATAESDPNYTKFAQYLARADRMEKEMQGDGTTAVTTSPEYAKQIQDLRAAAAQLAGPNLQAWQANYAKSNAQLMAQPAGVAAQDLKENDLQKLAGIVTESKGPLNRLSTAESMVMQSAGKKKTIANPVLNVSEDAKPSMIGKYFKAVETELAEAAERSKNRARNLAERVIERIVPGQEPAPGINRLTGKPIEPEAPAAPTEKPAVVPLNKRFDPRFKNGPEPYTIDIDGKIYKFAGRDKQGPGTGEVIQIPAAAIGIRGLGAVSVELGADGMYYPAPKINKESINQDVIAEELNELFKLRNQIEEAIKQRLDPSCWKGKHKEGTKIKGGVRVNNCVSNESVNLAQQAAIAIAKKKKAGKK